MTWGYLSESYLCGTCTLQVNLLPKKQTENGQIATTTKEKEENGKDTNVREKN